MRDQAAAAFCRPSTMRSPASNPVALLAVLAFRQAISDSVSFDCTKAADRRDALDWLEEWIDEDRPKREQLVRAAQQRALRGDNNAQA